MMKSYRRNALLAVVFFLLWLLGFATVGYSQGAKAQVIPGKFYVAPSLIKNPIQFEGSGFVSKEMVVVEMVLPQGVKIKGVKQGEDAVGLAYATADVEGNFKTAMQPLATLSWFFQVGWTVNGAPDFKEATLLTPGKYEIRAVGMASGTIAKTAMEVVAPPPEEKK